MVEEKIDKDGFIVTIQEESVPKEDREFAINVYSNNGEEICTVYTNNPTVARKYEKTKGKMSDESKETLRARMSVVRAGKK